MLFKKQIWMMLTSTCALTSLAVLVALLQGLREVPVSQSWRLWLYTSFI